MLGEHDAFGVDVEIMIRKHHMPHVFPGWCWKKRARGRLISIRKRSLHRRDFRGLPIVTIDGETARDFDDAVLVKRNDGGYELQVHIADVAQYVRPG